MNVVELTEKLKSKEALYAVLDQLPIHIIITDENGVIVYANKAVETITGFSCEEIIGQTPALWGKQMPQEFYENMWRTIKTEKKVFEAEVTNKNKSGNLYKAHAKIAPFFDPKNKSELIGFIGIEQVI